MIDRTVFTCSRLPARLTVSQAAAILGFMEHDIPILTRSRLLKPLGTPAPNAPKYFAGADIEEKARDVQWLDKATRVLAEHWRRKNTAKIR